MPLSEQEKRERKRIANKKYHERTKCKQADSESVVSESTKSEAAPEHVLEPVPEPEISNNVEIDRDVLDELIRVYQKQHVQQEQPPTSQQQAQQGNQPDFFFALQQNLISTAVGMLPLIAMRYLGTTSSQDIQNNTTEVSENTRPKSPPQHRGFTTGAPVRSVNLC